MSVLETSFISRSSPLKVWSPKGGNNEGGRYDTLAALMTAAFGLVVALEWNNPIKAVFKAIFGERGFRAEMIVYTMILTILAFIVTIGVCRAAAKARG